MTNKDEDRKKSQYIMGVGFFLEGVILCLILVGSILYKFFIE
jgi:hypothetical protein